MMAWFHQSLIVWCFMSFSRALVIVLVSFIGSASAKEIYVDNLGGRDSDDGQVAVARQGNTGPVKSLARAVQLARFADTIILKNTGTPYYESLSLMGNRHSGSVGAPFTIMGNGAVISGLRTVPPEGWRLQAPRLWKLTLTRKGYYQLLRDGKPLTEYIPDDGVNPLETLEAGQWVSWKGSLYFRQDSNDAPELQNFAVTADQTGISLHQVSNVQIVDVTLQHFRFDGLHAQGLCDNIELDNVSSVENGRAGIVSSGASTIAIFGGEIARNGRHQILAIDRSDVTRRIIEAPN